MKNSIKIFSIVIPIYLVIFTCIDIYNNKDHIELGDYLSTNRATTILDRDNKKLSLSYIDHWNPFPKPLGSFSPFLIQALIVSEDKRFHSHYGVDVLAKARAIIYNLKSLSFSQGGTTLSEQVVRILIDSPKSVWNRWVQSWLSLILESRYTKDEILEFYINQVPFSSNRRGFTQAANLYFGRDIETLNKSEMLALIVMLRAPSRFDLRKNDLVNGRAKLLASKLSFEYSDLSISTIQDIDMPEVPINSIVDFIRSQSKILNGKVRSTLDSSIQAELSAIVRQRITSLKRKGASHGAAMVVDHTTGEILAMVSENGEFNSFGYNTSLIPRQPGSTLKPFLYAAYFMQGGRPHHMIDDSPVSSVIAGGIHEVKNYSHNYYGELSTREALANSLNVPAIRTVRALGEDVLFELLTKAGVTLPKPASYYGEGLALGNAEISLFEMMQIYTCLANRGQCIGLKIDSALAPRSQTKWKLFDTEVADMILDILSDPKARVKEFGDYRFSHQVAVKTGTSTDYRDAWAFAINRKYLIGTWFGDLESKAMDEVTGSFAALPVVRTMIESLSLDDGPGVFSLSKRLYRDQWCAPKVNGCELTDELFVVGEDRQDSVDSVNDVFEMIPNASYLHLAIDPRIPKEKQVLKFDTSSLNQVNWSVNGRPVGSMKSFDFSLRPGTYEISAYDPSHSAEAKVKVYVHD